MTNAHGSFIWYELLTADPKAAKAFYDDVVGWNIDAESAPGGMDYRMIVTPDGLTGGVMGLSADMIAGGGKPVWLGYFGVDDVDASVASIVAAGGQVDLPAFDIPNVGRLAMVTDPQGIPFYVMRGASPDSSTAYQRMGMGHVSWNELLTPDDAAALAFYGEQFNITAAGTMPMGEMGDYTFIANTESNGEAIGAVMRTPPGGHSRWGFYFRVPDIEAAKAKIEAGGGKVRHGPMQVPGGEWVVSADDPEGVPFGLVAPGLRSEAMRKLTGGVFQSLDGVMQAPGGPTEDWTGGFKLGGWSATFWDEAMGNAMGGLFGGPFDLLLGRKTWEIFAAHWPYVDEDEPIGAAFDAANKYVLTRGSEPLEWQNSHRVASIGAVADIKAMDGPDLLIQGSTTLYPGLLAAGLIDRLFVMTFPVVLGSGKRLFGDGTPSGAFKLVSREVATTGVTIATYEPAGEVPIGTFQRKEPSEREVARQERMKREG